MADLDLTAAIDAGARAAWENRDIPPTPTWESLHEVERRAYRVSVAAAVIGAAPAILRAAAERAARTAGRWYEAIGDMPEAPQQLDRYTFVEIWLNTLAAEDITATAPETAPSASQSAQDGTGGGTEGAGAEGGSQGATAGLPRFAPDQLLTLDTASGIEEWTGQEWNDYAEAAVRNRSMITVRFLSVGPMAEYLAGKDRAANLAATGSTPDLMAALRDSMDRAKQARESVAPEAGGEQGATEAWQECTCTDAGSDPDCPLYGKGAGMDAHLGAEGAQG